MFFLTLAMIQDEFFTAIEPYQKHLRIFNSLPDEASGAARFRLEIDDRTTASRVFFELMDSIQTVHKFTALATFKIPHDNVKNCRMVIHQGQRFVANMDRNGRLICIVNEDGSIDRDSQREVKAYLAAHKAATYALADHKYGHHLAAVKNSLRENNTHLRCKDCNADMNHGMVYCPACNGKNLEVAKCQ